MPPEGRSPEAEARRALIVCSLADDSDQIDPAAFDFRIAVDGGLSWFRVHDSAPDLFLGDGDSSSAADQAWAHERDVPFRCVSADKDYSDFDLALEVCEERALTRAVVIGATGGRLDQQLGVFGSLLLHPTMRVTLQSASQFALCLFAGQDYCCAEPLRYVSVMALEPAVVTLRNVRWELKEAPLEIMSTRGMSNEPCGAELPYLVIHSGVVVFIGQR